jgi:hypothetical protein
MASAWPVAIWKEFHPTLVPNHSATAMKPRHRRLSKVLLPLALVAMPASVLAQSQAPGEGLRRFRPEQRQEMFQALRDLERRSHAARIAILQEADRCIAAASTWNAFQSCERQEKQARERFKVEIRSEAEGLRARFGLPPRQDRTGSSARPPKATI